MANITYAIEISEESGEQFYVPLTATTPDDAIDQMRQYVAEHRDTEQQRYLGWYRQTDSSKGYINPGGNVSSTGKAWGPLTSATVYFDSRSNPANPGWVCELDTDYHEQFALDATSEDASDDELIAEARSFASGNITVRR